MEGDSNALDPTDPKHVGNQLIPISPGIVGSSNPPPVPEDFPREPVPPGGRGEGWPYAPQGWPKPDDKWGWRVGKRATTTLLWSDRYVALPMSLLNGRKAIEFASRKRLMEYCKLNFPQMTDPSNIFEAFDWKVPIPKEMEPTVRQEPIAERDKLLPTNENSNFLGPTRTHRPLPRSRARRRERVWEDSPHPSEAISEKLAAHVISVSSSDLSTRLQIQEKSQYKPLGRTQQIVLYDASPAEHRVGALPGCHGGDGVATTSDTSLQPLLNVEASDYLLQCMPSLLSRLKPSVCKPRTLSIEEHMKECEAMSDRIKRAGQLEAPPGELAVPVSSSSEATSRSLSNRQVPGGDDVIWGQSVEAPGVEPPTVASLGMTSVARLEGVFEDQINETLKKLKRAHASEYASAEASLNVQKNFLVEQYCKLVPKDNHLLKDQEDNPRPVIDHAQLQKAQEGQDVFESMLAISHGFGQAPKEFLRQFFNWPPSDTVEA